MDPNTAIISIDGISAFDQISRAAMLDGLMNVEGEGKVVPFVRMFYGSRSSYLWEDASGVTHDSPRRTRRTRRSTDVSLFVGSTQCVSGNIGRSVR